MKIKSTKGKEGISLELPSQFCEQHGISESSAYDIFHLRDGFFLIAKEGMLPLVAKEGAPQANAWQGALRPVQQAPIPSMPSTEELTLLRKLSQIKFQDRVPSAVEKQLSQEEKRVLQSLVQKKLIFAFFGGKYSKGGVYNIPDSVYPMLNKQPASAQAPQPGLASPQKPAHPASQPPITPPAKHGHPEPMPQKPSAALPPISTYEHFEQAGYCIVEKEGDIRMMHERLKEKISSGSAVGVRAFDKKLYAASKRFFSSCEDKIRPLLDSKGHSLEQIAKSAGLNEDAALVALVILCDSGEAIERRKGFYSIA
jgi:hypothetical protein